ncbi:MAG: glucose 1-dehydrogenase [Armatimonadetes bacterium]|nr:glucose 1-dehydrogenase [Armatimonadota bacterium]NIM23341.1 glucose 1-dehydrogenase [Armatimonadota bacterium]NIM67205.1 glucose 1-dehydrogenase [Armatimonadota bacterium]NIM75730.1 glucose 1-dehydrogenase [Armatimonadota bacterium]NIN05394.1 glucose 1-dehydrogenase [Armatimonadota bacterium]
MDLELTGKAALITGASRGIGAAAALALAQEGASVAINYLTSESEAQKVVESIRGNGGRASLFQADVSKADQVQAMVGAVLDEYKQIDILVNNAGITTHTGRIDGFGAEDIEKCMAVNVSGMLNCIQAVTPHMKSRRYGKIINVISFRAYATRYSSPYDISKAAALALTIEVASELAPFNINVVSISPGTAATDMNREKLLSDAKKLREFEAKIPLGRIAQPEDIANLICFLSSDRAKHITGTDILITGGEIFRW